MAVERMNTQVTGPDIVDEAVECRLRKLGGRERMELLSVVRDILEFSGSAVSQDERALLDDRLRALEQCPADQSAWEEVRKRLTQSIP